MQLFSLSFLHNSEFNEARRGGDSAVLQKKSDGEALKCKNYDVGYDFNKNLSEGRGLASARY